MEKEYRLLSPEDARSLIDGVGHGVIKKCLGIDKSTLWRYLERERDFPPYIQIAIWNLCQDATLRADVIAGIPLKRRGILKSLLAVRLTGYGTGEVERDRGGVFHAMERFNEFGRAVCGEEPGLHSGGWCQVDGSINCPRCLKRIDKWPIVPKSSGA